MQERPQNFDELREDPEATLVAPRFDAEEARRAEPVVPLAETRAHAPNVNARAVTRRGPRRSWPTALLAVVMLAVVAAGAVVATKVMRRPLPDANAQTEAVPPQAEVAPPETAEATRPQEASPAAHSARGEASAKRPSRTPRGRETEAGMILAPNEILRGDDEDSDDEDDERRDRAKERRRERGDDEAEKEMRKALKRAKGKAPRLVGVLTGP